MQIKELRIFYHYASGKITNNDKKYNRDEVITGSKGGDDK
jgi:hypothetical protein